MKLVVLAAIAGLSFVAAPAWAADAPAPAAPDAAAPLPEPSPQALALARRYIDGLHFQRTMDTMMANMMPAMMKQMEQANPDFKKLPPEFTAAMIEVVNGWAHEETPRMVEQMVRLTAQIYTEQELQDLLAFQESPTGRSVQAKAPLFTAHTGELMKTMHPPSIKDLLEQVCKKVDCVKLLAPAPDLPGDANKKS